MEETTFINKENTTPDGIVSRRSPRLSDYDYAASAYYFITVCAEKHRCVFGAVTETVDNGRMRLNENGKKLDEHIRRIGDRYSTVRVKNYVIMPNHIHMIIELDNDNKIPLTQVVGSFKSGVSRDLGFSVWQRSFYDRVIRSEKEYLSIWEYIDNNPAQWAVDKYYP